MRLLFAALLTGLTVAGAALAGPAAAAPVADFSVSPAEPRAGQAVSFFADPWGCDARPCVYRWTEAHADGTETVVGFGRVSTLAYDAPGAVSMVLTVTSRAFRAPPGPRSAADAERPPVDPEPPVGEVPLDLVPGLSCQRAGVPSDQTQLRQIGRVAVLVLGVGLSQPPGRTLTAEDHRAAPGNGGWRPERGCYTDAGSMHTEVPDARVVLDVEPRDHRGPLSACGRYARLPDEAVNVSFARCLRRGGPGAPDRQLAGVLGPRITAA